MIPTPYRFRDMVGPPDNFCIHEGYTPRLDAWEFDDTPLKDEWQLPVYVYAREVYDRERLDGVCDIGCGSGFKLMKFFRDCRTIGIDIPPTVQFVREVYPDRDWFAGNLWEEFVWGCGLIIASDVIEHLPDPGELVGFLRRSKPKRIILSTPERDLLNAGTWDGPPKNIHHVREWNYAELHAYLGQSFTVVEHFVVEATQIAELQMCPAT
jgi:hypothetical protein